MLVPTTSRLDQYKLLYSNEKAGMTREDVQRLSRRSQLDGVRRFRLSRARSRRLAIEVHASRIVHGLRVRGVWIQLPSRQQLGWTKLHTRYGKDSQQKTGVCQCPPSGKCDGHRWLWLQLQRYDEHPKQWAYSLIHSIPGSWGLKCLVGYGTF